MTRTGNTPGVSTRLKPEVPVTRTFEYEGSNRSEGLSRVGTISTRVLPKTGVGVRYGVLIPPGPQLGPVVETGGKKDHGKGTPRHP